MNDSEIQLFQNEEFGEIRTIEIDGEPWFVGNDVAVVLGYNNPRDAFKKHVDEEDKRQDDGVAIRDSIGREQHPTIINESGLYSLVLSSKLPSAKKFKRWVTSEILPKSRKIANSLENIEFNGSIDGIVYSKVGVPTTTSRKIADVFHKKHREVLRLIDNKRNGYGVSVQFCTDHIKEIIYYDSQGRPQREYELDEAGFSYIALGLTGDKADEFKIKYITAFNQMRESLNNLFKARLVESVLPQDNRNRQFVYVIENSDNGAIKIGVANDPEKRLAQLQTGSVSELCLVYQSYICSNAFNIESQVHQHFRDKHIRGEWYAVSKDDVIAYLEQQNFVLKSEFVKYLSLI